MFKVVREGADFPSILSSDSAAAARRAIEKVLNLEAVDRAQRRIPFDAEIYSASEVRDALYSLFRGRCAFCEGQLGKNWPVHHFRPLRGATEVSGEVSEDHYAWFAYEWGNLYPACSECVRERSSKFPVKGRRAAPFSTLTEARNAETALLLDPCWDDPSRHLDFHWNGTCYPSSKRGRITVEIYNLDRSELIHSRRRLAGELLEYLETAPDASPSDSQSSLAGFIDTRPGALATLLRRFVVDLGDRMGRRLPSRDPKIALRAFLKDFEPVAYKACIDGARGEMQDNAAPGAFPSATSRSSSVGFKADSRSDVTLPARQLQMSSVSIQNFKALSEISFAFPELSVVRYFETEGCLT